MVKARRAVLTVEVDTLLPHAELKQLRGLVFGQLKGGERKTIKGEKPIGTQHDCYGLIRQVQANIVGPAEGELWDEPSGHPRRKDWKPKRKRKARRTSKRRAARDTAKEAKGPSPKAPRKPRPSEIRRKAEREAAKAQAAAAG
jgi:hypothetical protein